MHDVAVCIGIAVHFIRQLSKTSALLLSIRRALSVPHIHAQSIGIINTRWRVCGYAECVRVCTALPPKINLEPLDSIIYEGTRRH